VGSGVSEIPLTVENDSNRFLSAAGDLIVTGPTHTNVNDVSFVLVSGKAQSSTP
jgi:glycerate-2-kinase